ncbi:MAG: amidohydrolase family protein, partial [Victivallales bacterium]|nr:amidohydrolase family protein [Victivallales bacterium]
MSLLITNAHLITPGLELKGAAILVADKKIRRVIPAGEALPQADETYDAKGQMVVPGFIDMHFHGAMGYETTTDDPKAMPAIGEAKLREGVTNCCPTTLTLSEEKLAASLRHIENYRQNPTGAQVIGTHLEGPYVNPECLGAQNPAYQRNPDLAEINRLHAVSPVSLITYAIELPGAVDFTDGLVAMGIVPSCGHTNATLAQFEAGKTRGLRRLTHYCNQMTKLHHREIGMVGCGLLHPEVYIEMICDKIHLCPDMIRLVFQLKGLRQAQLVALGAAGLAVVKDDKARVWNLDER